MAVVSLKNRLTNNITDFESYKKSNESLIFSDSINSPDNFSIDFTIGERWAEYAAFNSTPVFYNVNNYVEIKPKDSIIVVTKEKILIPYNIYGIIMPTGSLFINYGIFCNTAKIEPGYADKLFLLLYNSTNSIQKLNIGDKIASAIFFNTDLTIDAKEINRYYPDAIKKPNKFKIFIKSIGTNYKANPFLFILDLLKIFIAAASGAVAAKLIF